MKLDLDLELIYHIAIPESIAYIQIENISPNIVEDDDAREILEWQIDYISKYEEPASADILCDEFDIEYEEPQTNIEDLLERLRTRYVRNNGRDILEDISHIAVNDPLSLSSAMVSRGKELSELTLPRGESFRPNDTDVLIKKYNEDVVRGRGPSFGFEDIDQHFYGQKGVTYCMGVPKSYKSWLGVINGVQNSYQGNIPYIYSLEMPGDEYTWRLKCLEADIPYWKYLKNSLSPQDIEAIKSLPNGNWIVDKPKHQERSVMYLMEKAINYGADYVIIDQLQYVEASNGYSLGALNDTKYYWEVCEAFRSYSDRIPIFILHQFNRSARGLETMPDFQQAKGSAAIEETATLALGTYSTKDMRQSNIFRFGSMASRHYQDAEWEINVNLTRGCSFNLIERVEE